MNFLETCMDISPRLALIAELVELMTLIPVSSPELQISGSYEDNSKIIFLIFQQKHML